MARLILLALMAASLGSAGVARAEDMNGMDMGKGGADKAFADAMQSMMKTMSMKTTGQPDVDFVTMMIPHHQGAIDMAKVELRYGKDPKLRDLATAIVTAQEKEIADMKAWLAQHGH